MIIKKLWNRLFTRHFHHVIIINDGKVTYFMNSKMHSYDPSTFELMFFKIGDCEYKSESVKEYKKWVKDMDEKLKDNNEQ